MGSNCFWKLLKIWCHNLELEEIILILWTSNRLLISLIQISTTVDYFLCRNIPTLPRAHNFVLYILINITPIPLSHDCVSVCCFFRVFQEGNYSAQETCSHISHMLNAHRSPTHTHRVKGHLLALLMGTECMFLVNTYNQNIFQNLTV